MQLESITSFIQCNILIPLFSITESLPCPVTHECDANSVCITHPKYPFNPYCKCKAHYEKSNDGACVGKIFFFGTISSCCSAFTFFNSAIRMRPIRPELNKFENIVFILKLPSTIPSTSCRINATLVTETLDVCIMEINKSFRQKLETMISEFSKSSFFAPSWCQ